LEQMGDMMLDAEVFVGSRALKPLLEKLHVLIKEIQGSDFSFEDLGKRIQQLQRFIGTNYNMGNLEEFADEAFRKVVQPQISPSMSSSLGFIGGRLTYTSVAHGSYHYLKHGNSMIMERVWPEYLENILMKVCDVARTLAQQLVERFPRKDFLDSLSILQSTC
jgi:hypothetical protein